MKKLEDIAKRNIFEVPDKYFDQLAMTIQSRTEQLPSTRSVRTWRLSLRYALPALLLIIGAIFVLRPKTVQSTEELLATVPTEHLMAYLDESDINEQDLLDAVNFDNSDADSLTLKVQDEYLPNDLEASEYKSVLENEL